VKAATERLFGMPLGHGYGVTEAAPTIAQTLPNAYRNDLSVGPPLPGIETRLVPAPDLSGANGEVSELWVRGPNVMRGYYRAPAETAAVIDAEGWLNTGDLARLVDGDIFLLGRSRELIIRFGFNVHPSEVEAALNAHPAVLHSAVLGRPADGDEEIVAFVQTSPGMSVTAEALMLHAGERLASYKLPSQIVFVAAMPMALNGKILKHELRMPPKAAARAATSTTTRPGQP
jgi:acyl-CoA synthetase (AMP-forming)/AMP-acid ligase II